MKTVRRRYFAILLTICLVITVFGANQPMKRGRSSAVGRRVAEIAHTLRDLRNTTVGEVAEDLPRFAINAGPGPFVAEAMLQASKPHGAQLAILAPEQVHTNVRPGPLTAFECYRTVAWHDHLSLVTLTGSEIAVTLAEITSRRLAEFRIPAFVHAAGIRFVLDTARSGGDRILNLEIGSKEEGYTPISAGERYKVAVTSHMVNYIKRLRQKRACCTENLSDLSMGPIFTDYMTRLAQRGPIENPKEIRVKLVFARIAVISDPHYFEPSLLVNNGIAFQTYIAQDRKLIAESDAILRAAVSSIRADKPDICLVPGDLTKDGELISHESVASLLRDSLESAGIKVYVVPGNHDINNPQAYSYDGPNVSSVPTVTSAEFEAIYAQMGYSEAIDRDSHSLSYIVEPTNGLWIFGLDACEYDTNIGHSHTGGSLSDSTLAWLTARLDEAAENNITTMAFMHHGLTEHYVGQTTIMGGMFEDYVIDNWRSIRDTLANHGLRTVFTGHYHAQDIVKRQTQEGNVIYDIETGATVTWPCPIRSVDLRRGAVLDIVTRRIEQVDYDTGNLSFQAYAKEYLQTGLTNLISYMLIGMFGVDPMQAGQLSPAVARAYMAHYAGDEMPTQHDHGLIATLKMSPDPIIQAMGASLESIWTDLEPADNTVRLELE